MLLVTAATDMEMDAFTRCCPPSSDCAILVTGVGQVEAAVRLTAFLAGAPQPPVAVVNFGVAGAYVFDDREGADLLDICLAEREVLADLGLCFDEEIRSLHGQSFTVLDTFDLDEGLRRRAEAVLGTADIPYKRGVFATVNCVSSTRRRGTMVAGPIQALCENMEGAAVARTCTFFGLPMLELRCISNLVEDRQRQKWRLRQACARCGEVTAHLVKGLLHG